MTLRFTPVLELGLTEKRIKQMDDLKTADFSEREKLALEFTGIFATSPVSATDEFFKRLKTHFTEKEVAELGIAVIMYQGLHRFNTMADVGPINPDGLTYIDLPY